MHAANSFLIDILIELSNSYQVLSSTRMNQEYLKNVGYGQLVNAYRVSREMTIIMKSVLQ